MKTKIKYLLVLTSLLSIASCNNTDDSVSSIKEKEIECETVQVHTALQANYLKDDYFNIFNYAEGNEELSKPNPVVIKTNVFENIKRADKYVVEISNDEDFTNVTTYETRSLRISLTNLYIGIKYYYRITATLDDVSYTSEVKCFMVEDTCPRNIDVDGVTNFRDMGGYKTVDGKTINQGLIYRSGALGYSTNTYYITETGKDTYKNQLNIKTEIDLRVSEVNTTSYVDGVNYYHCPMDYSYTYFPNYGDGEGVKQNTDSIRDVFKILADENNYPCNFHCQIGTDRTGFIAFLLLNILNVDISYIYYDFLFSNFGYIQAKRDVSPITSYFTYLKDYGANESLKTQSINYLLDIGVTQTEINNIISNLTF